MHRTTEQPFVGADSTVGADGLGGSDGPPAGAIGPYRVTGILGQGGMGVVYAAEQLEPIRRRVAVKVIRAGMHASVVARFAAERQALAVMEHPSIAKVFDAGATAQGSPYFVMEYVEGVPITRYCDERRLSTRERLRLFVPVCHAVQHAHQKGVIHRDLKPSNVLVTEQAGEALPKVIDFGIAKAVGRRLTDETLATEFGVVVGTPAYMSPEQAEGAGVDVDTRSDVYALGVVLYELLVGSLPVDPAEMGLVPFIARLMSRLTVPPAPSSRIVDMRAAATGVATRHGTEPAALVRELRGDLDAIVLKAIAPERERRYQTVQEFAQDVERFLRHEPVAARAPSVGYRAGKFVRRHPAAVAAAASAVLFLAGLSAVTTVQARRVARARAVAEQRRTQAEELIGYMVGELRGRLEPIGQLELLDDVGTRALAYFAAVPPGELRDAELYRRSQALGQIGQVRMAQGDLVKAMQAYRESLAQARDLAARDAANADWQVQLGAGHFWVGYAHYLQGGLDSAMAHFAPYLAISRRLVARDSTNADWQLELAYAHSNIGSVREAQGDLAGALEAFRYALGVDERLVARDTSNTTWLLDLANTHNTTGRAHERMGRLDSARAHYQADLAIKRALVARDTSNTTWQRALGTALSYAGGVEEMSGALGPAAALRAAAYGNARALVRRDSANTDWVRDYGASAYRLGRLEVAAGRRADGLERLRDARRTLRALAARDTTNSDVQLQVANAEFELARALAAGGAGDRAAARAGVVAAESLLLPAASGADHQPRISLARARLLSAELHDRDGSRALARRARVAALGALGADRQADQLEAVEARARALAGLGRVAEAAPLVERLRRAGYRESGFVKFAAAFPEGGVRPR